MEINNALVKKNNLLRKSSREQLKGNWGKCILLCFLFSLITGLPETINSITNINAKANILLGADPSEIISGIIIRGIICVIITLVLCGPFTFGLASCFMKLVRKEPFRFENLFDGFQHFVSTIVLTLLETLFMFLWSLLFIIPGIIAYYRYSMAFYILNDNPEIGALEALSRSKQMMAGYKWKLFCLYFSFIGWGIVSCITLGIGLFWLIPYINTSIANFYENLKNASETNSNLE
ncbi:DUF975 family protein [Clostridium sp. P21]|uniref:DUF975 family protein n=1 Tax=Clostridium muellerianum TaxID=2716538 RepID=A0A7Y0EM59_9CLOT|nr:DUF975 family protein [Clostridium muellerianum]NMM66023.1 DUF975 family protein [Clostridium muellerianum]